MRQFFALLAFPLVVSPALAAGPEIIEWNGFLLRLEASLTERPQGDPAQVIEKATTICGTVGRTPQIDSYEQISDFRYVYTIICA